MPNKGRIDSTSTNEVTVINTILNKNLTVTDEGNAIRRRIELELQLDESPKDNLEIMKIMKNAPDISSRFSFLNGILVAIFFKSNFHNLFVTSKNEFSNSRI